MKKILLFLLLLLSLTGMTQTNSLTYKLIKENTDIKFVNSKLAVWDILISESRMTFSGGIAGRLYLNGLYLGLNYDYCYLDNMAEFAAASDPQGSSVYVPTRSRNGEATVGYFFQKETKGKVKIKLKQQGKTTYYAKIDAIYNKILGMQLSYKKGFSHLTMPAGIQVKDYYATESNPIVLEKGATTYMNYGWIAVGPSYGKIEDVSADFEGIGKRKLQYFQRFYANMLLATNSQLEDIYYSEGGGSTNGVSNSLVHRYVLDGNVKMSKVGFNLGYEVYKFNKFGVCYGVELGLMPGVKNFGSGNGYLSVKWGFTFGQDFGAK